MRVKREEENTFLTSVTKYYKILSLKPGNFCGNGRPEIPEIPVYFRYAFDCRKCANSDK